ncbi:Serine/threonine-protein kinase pkn1 [Rubripirellula tenax]|uniref:Serine/threonine-protein kinase pkn1 n=1 Tax=Rubripirellula tenax TaxID=2528015 RepID=A0A5C6FGY6_9BACT|nr:SUMF1/EgtB/PvdO family nonheme iron enzyme [Rubripirellula tenax]TWU59434.1 Serine/threonine-protein kinase pkn1 [Rubripirellula tenax]
MRLSNPSTSTRRRVLSSAITSSVIAAIAIAISATPVLAEAPATTAVAAQDTLGISATQPESGPSVKVDGGYMVPYTSTIPGTDVTIEMVPVPGGKFLMGSPDDEADRGDDEGPQVDVIVDPMWVAKTETTWAQFKEFMRLYAIFKSFEASGQRPVNDDNRVDAITAPTELYEPSYTFEYGEDPAQPAVTMTLYSAQQFTKWLSRVTGIQYRLPTEAEWEYAARAGSTTPYSWGDDEGAIDDYAWYFDNADSGQMPVGTKKPNAFGLHDMHGNVAELTVNMHTETYDEYKSQEPINATDVLKWGTESASGVVARGGSWESDAEQVRSAARIFSDDEAWKEEDPNFPRSPWWFTSDPARGVGFRLFRGYTPIPADKVTNFYEAVAEEVISDVESRVQGGRGGYGLVDPTLPDAIRDMK